jgi:hypothetical protein
MARKANVLLMNPAEMGSERCEHSGSREVDGRGAILSGGTSSIVDELCAQLLQYTAPRPSHCAQPQLTHHARDKHTQSYGHAGVAPTSHVSHSYRCGHHDITYFHSTGREWRNVGQAAHRATRNTTLRQGACSENGSRGRGGQQRSTARAQSTCV